MAGKKPALLCIILLLMLTPGFAPAAEKPLEAAGGPGITNLQCLAQDNGDVVVSWDDGGKGGPYTVGYRAAFDAHELGPVNSNSVTLEYLIPGESYMISVSNGESTASTGFTVPRTVFDELYSFSKKITLSQTEFSITQADADQAMQYELRVHFPQLRKDRAYKGKLVTKTPLGYGGLVWVWPRFDLESRYSFMPSYFSLREFFDGIREDFGEVPLGEYTLEMYFDGQLYADTSFNVTR